MIVIEFKLEIKGAGSAIEEALRVLCGNLFNDWYGYTLELDDIKDEYDIEIHDEEQEVIISEEKVTGDFLPDEEFVDWFSELGEKCPDVIWNLSFFEADSSMCANRAYRFEHSNGKTRFYRTDYFENYPDCDEDSFDYNDRFVLWKEQ